MQYPNPARQTSGVAAGNATLLQALRGLPTFPPPVWAMRQAGRWDPEFRTLRSSLGFYEFAANAELAARASLLPARFGVDAIILFYDITTLAAAMGLAFEYRPGVGPVPRRPIADRAEVERLAAEPEEGRFAQVVETLLLVKRELAGRLPVLVFAGAPFTLACYCTGAGKEIDKARQFARQAPDAWELLLERIEQATVHFLEALARRGADAYQLFDSWAGALTAAEYDAWAQTRHQAIFARAAAIPSILFVKECPYLNRMAAAGARAVSLGTIHDLRSARAAHPQLVFQGNVDQHLLRTGTPDQVAAATRRAVEQGGGVRHIVNLSHGVDPATPPANFEAYVQAVKEARGP